MLTWIEMWERVEFKGQECVSWRRSWDGGRTWEDVPWPGEMLPFLLLGTAEGEEYTHVRQRTLLDELLDSSESAGILNAIERMGTGTPPLAGEQK